MTNVTNKKEMIELVLDAFNVKKRKIVESGEKNKKIYSITATIPSSYKNINYETKFNLFEGDSLLEMEVTISQAIKPMLEIQDVKNRMTMDM